MSDILIAVALLATAAAVGALIMYCYCQCQITKWKRKLKSAQNEICHGNHDLELQLAHLTDVSAIADTKANIWKEQCEEYMTDINIFRAELGLPPKKVEQKYKVTF